LHSVLPQDPGAVQTLTRAAARHAATLREDGTWADIDYADQASAEWNTRDHLKRIEVMARAHRLSPDRSLPAKIYAALDYWLAQDFKNPNWWHNEIGTPQIIGTIDLLLGPDLSAAQKEKSLEILRRSDWTKWTGQNLVWGVNNQIMRGLLENDADTVAAAYARLYEEVRISKDEGIQPDFSFHQHGPQLYSGGYGLNFAQDVPRLVGFSWGTRWQISDEKMR